MATTTPFPASDWLESTRSSKILEPPSWKLCLLRALLTIALACVALAFPFSALFAFTLVFAAFAFVDGLFSLATCVRRVWLKQSGWAAKLFRGLIGIGLGGAFLAMPMLVTFSSSLATLALLAAWATMTGIAEVSAATRYRKEMKGEWLLILSGVLSLLLGIAIPVVLFVQPQSFVSLAWVIGIYALFTGFTHLWKALSLRNALRSAGG